MPFKIEYLPEHNLIIERFYGTVTLEDVRDLNRQGAALIEAADKTTHLLVDLRYVEKFPTSLNQIRQMLVVSHNPRLGWVVLLTNDNKMMKMVAAVITQVSAFGIRFRMFDESLQALGFLEGLGVSRNVREVLLPQLSRPPV